MVTVNLHGALRELLVAAFPDTGGSVRLAVATPVEALVALMRQVPGMEQVVRAAEFRLATADSDDLSAELAQLRFGKNAVLDIHPVAVGAGGNVITAAFNVAFSTYAYREFIKYLTPNVDNDERGSVDSRASYLADGAVNSQAQGGAVPLVYGRFLVGSRLVSGGIYSSRIPYIPPPPAASPPDAPPDDDRRRGGSGGRWGEAGGGGR